MIYVDNYYLICSYGGMRMSHLFSHREDELHEFAHRLGLRRSWFHRDHYDISFSKRELALQLGARPITYRQMSRIVSIYRRTGGIVIMRRYRYENHSPQ